jgi:ABC-type nitrate/sulfonate/bicarbonate transport system substrate-binding protein
LRTFTSANYNASPIVDHDTHGPSAQPKTRASQSTLWFKFAVTAILSLIAVGSAAQELVKVPVQIPSISPAIGAFAIARDPGYYRQEGLDVQLIVISSALGMQALLAGNIKFSTAGGSGLLPILRGAPVK